jgi:hypothetical protein
MRQAALRQCAIGARGLAQRNSFVYHRLTWLAPLRQGLRRARWVWLLARNGRISWQENGTSGAEKGIAYIYAPM